MNGSKQTEKENLTGIIETKNRLTNKECKGIIRERKWEKNCPKCNRIISYVNKYVLQKGIESKSICKWCRTHTKKTKERMSGSNNGMYGIHRYDKLNPFYGKQHTNEAKRKMRIAACKRILELQRNDKDGRINNIGTKEGKYFSQIERDRGWNGIYYEKSHCQHLIGELGYFVDYYEPTLNIVIEYDEPRHYYNGVLKTKDIKRMKEIKTYLKCEFWRYDEYNKRLMKF
jgi:very-short-patch-repair endonuclease